MIKKIFSLCFFLFIGTVLFAHVIPYSLEKMSDETVISTYLILGFQHIIPLGFDHILFILCVFFLNTNMKKVILQASMFTLAHTITLGLSMYGIINPPAHIIEPLIAISIIFLALENIYSDHIKPWRLAMVFLFGLVHGMGFASALGDLGMPDYAFGKALLSFNVGVELGQLTIITLMYFFVNKPFSRTTWYRKKIVVPVSLMIALIAGYWTIERIFFV